MWRAASLDQRAPRVERSEAVVRHGRGTAYSVRWGCLLGRLPSEAVGVMEGVMDVLTVPQLAIPTAHEAVTRVNAWLHREVGMAVHATTAHFDPTTFCWHLPIELAYATHGTLGVVGDVYLHAATGAFVGRPSAAELIRRAERLAAACGIDGC